MILQCGDLEKLIKKRKNPEESPMNYLSIEDTYEVIRRAHLSTGHGGRYRMLREIQKNMQTSLMNPWNYLKRFS